MNDVDRKRAVSALLDFDGPLDVLLLDLHRAAPGEAELATLCVGQLRSALDRFLAGRLTPVDLENWADAIEGCDMISYDADQEDLLKQIVFALANPTINGEITPSLARDLLRRISD